MSQSVNSVMTSRITGLASGLDTEAIVADMLSASKLKIAEVEQKKQILEWKKEFYQEIATSLYNFQNKYFSGTASVLENALKSLKATSSSPFVTVTATSSFPSQSIYIHDIISLATNTTVVSSSRVSANPKITVNTDKLSALGGKIITVSLDGVERTLKFDENIEYKSVGDVASELQNMLDKAFGKGRVAVSITDGQIELSAEASTLTLKMPADAAPADVLYFDNLASNRVDLNVSLESAGLAGQLQTDEDGKFLFVINGVEIEASINETLNSIIAKINKSGAGVKITYSQLTDKFTLTATESGAAADIEFEDKTGNLLSVLFGGGVKTQGTDAVVRLSTNGSSDELITVTRSTNTISFDGVTITLNGMAEGAEEEKITVTFSRDVDALVEQIKSFIADYNELLSKIVTKLSEEYDPDYLPLTEDQKKGMTEEEIKLWTEKAKTGLLRNDIYLTNIANQLRSIFYTPIMSLVEGDDPIGTFADIGIATTKYADKGKLTVDEKKLREALQTNPEKVINLFTQKSGISYSLYATQEQQNKRFNQSGVLDRLLDILRTNLNKVGKKGALITLVGSPDDSFKGDTEYTKRINALKKKIDELNVKLAYEEERYWKQFTAMEKALANLQAQSSWLMSMIWGNSNR
ncbi:MAG TPA: flagellar filament capping protein FliD [Clostridiales bacterium]|nr:flagellar filament capping protein FliD [Clostridiales bacterium]